MFADDNRHSASSGHAHRRVGHSVGHFERVNRECCHVRACRSCHHFPRSTQPRSNAALQKVNIPLYHRAVVTLQTTWFKLSCLFSVTFTVRGMKRLSKINRKCNLETFHVIDLNFRDISNTRVRYGFNKWCRFYYSHIKHCFFTVYKFWRARCSLDNVQDILHARPCTMSYL